MEDREYVFQCNLSGFNSAALVYIHGIAFPAIEIKERWLCRILKFGIHRKYFQYTIINFGYEN
ncbi:MAG: hypothetical protein B6D37_08460 [Sphingobacteriales bacterium UTBCD1]|nr:MAG: hypothetical protein B6D37_08460 [Sphingobacteriales bacterium UTBCD1]